MQFLSKNTKNKEKLEFLKFMPFVDAKSHWQKSPQIQPATHLINPIWRAKASAVLRNDDVHVYNIYGCPGITTSIITDIREPLS